MRPTLLLTVYLALFMGVVSARETLAVPAVSVELLFGGEGKVTVDGKPTKLTGEQATKLKADMAALKVDEMRRDLSKLQDLDSDAAKAAKESATRDRAVEREKDRVADQLKLIATLEKRLKEAQDDLNDATARNYNVSLDGLRSKVNAINSSLNSERKDLERAKERLALAEKRQKENAAAGKTATTEASALRKDLAGRIEKMKAVLKAAGVEIKG